MADFTRLPSSRGYASSRYFYRDSNDTSNPPYCFPTTPALKYLSLSGGLIVHNTADSFHGLYQIHLSQTASFNQMRETLVHSCNTLLHFRLGDFFLSSDGWECKETLLELPVLRHVELYGCSFTSATALLRRLTFPNLQTFDMWSFSGNATELLADDKFSPNTFPDPAELNAELRSYRKFSIIRILGGGIDDPNEPYARFHWKIASPNMETLKLESIFIASVTTDDN